MGARDGVVALLQGAGRPGSQVQTRGQGAEACVAAWGDVAALDGSLGGENYYQLSIVIGCRPAAVFAAPHAYRPHSGCLARPRHRPGELSGCVG